jgi:hypothetical protein
MARTHRLPVIVSLAAAALMCSGCSTSWLKKPEPWVKPYERNYLADPIMSFSRDPVDAAYVSHVKDVREGARGAHGGGGGGCGCN